jgi:hypothetical protein
MAPTLTELAAISTVEFPGQSITVKRGGPCNQWVATGWKNGKPVANLPLDDRALLDIMGRYKFVAA